MPSSFKARPTTDFAKENIFNVLRRYVNFEGTICLDLFGGTGSITLELLSRGASRVVCVEKDWQHYGFIREMLRKLGDDNGVVVKGDVMKYLDRCTEMFDFIFADPPYKLENLGQLPELVMGTNAMGSGTVFVLEHGAEYDFSGLEGFVEHRAYGSVNFSIFIK